MDNFEKLVKEVRAILTSKKMIIEQPALEYEYFNKLEQAIDETIIGLNKLAVLNRTPDAWRQESPAVETDEPETVDSSFAEGFVPRQEFPV